MIIKELPKYLDTISPLLVLIFALTRKNILWRKDYLFWFIVFQALLNGTAALLELFKTVNYYIYHINCAVSFLILSEYFRHTLVLRKISLVITIILVVFFVFFFWSIIMQEGLATFNSPTYSLASFILVAYSFLYYLEQILHPTIVTISKSRDFWFVTGIFTYYAGCFFIFITYCILIRSSTGDIGFLWKTHNVFLFIMCVYLFTGFKCKTLAQEK